MGTVPLSELFQLDVGNVNSPSKGAGVGGQAGSSVAAAAGAGGTNRSESSSPTSTLKKEQHRARASVSGIEEAESLAINTSATLGSQLVWPMKRLFKLLFTLRKTHPQFSPESTKWKYIGQSTLYIGKKSPSMDVRISNLINLSHSENFGV